MPADFFAIKRKVRDIITGALDDDFVTTFGFTKKNPPRTWCYFGGLTWPEGENKTNRSREYEVNMPIVLNAIKPSRMGNEDAEEWLAGQVTALIAAFSATSDLRSVGVISWILVPHSFGSQPHTEGIEVQAVLELQVTYRATP